MKSRGGLFYPCVKDDVLLSISRTMVTVIESLMRLVAGPHQDPRQESLIGMRMNVRRIVSVVLRG